MTKSAPKFRQTYTSSRTYRPDPTLPDLEIATFSCAGPIAEAHQHDIWRGVRFLDLTSVLAGRNPREMVVNPFDAHPNEALHLEIAERLYEELARGEFGMAERRMTHAPPADVSAIDRS